MNTVAIEKNEKNNWKRIREEGGNKGEEWITEEMNARMNEVREKQ